MATESKTVERQDPAATRAGWLGRGLLGLIVVGGLAVLVPLSVRLAAMRIFQVDEGCNVYVATVLARDSVLWKSGGFTIDCFQLLISWLDRGATRSIELFVTARFVMLEIFWLNLILLASATGERFLSARWLLAFIGAATLAPLWDYGMEIRHDNLLLTGMLLCWCGLRAQPTRLATYFVVGFCAVALEFVAVKALVYVVPLSLLVLVLPPAGHPGSRWKLAAAWFAGAVSALALARLVLGWTGFWGCYLHNFGGLASVPASALRFWPWDHALPRLVTQTPLLLAVLAGALVAAAALAVRKPAAMLQWEGTAPEVALLGIAFAALCINPNPYPYNLLHLVPYAFLLAFRHGSSLWNQLPPRQGWATVLVGIVVLSHLVPFGIATRRHLTRTNSRQEGLMTQAENLTDPSKDPVYDAIGMVPTRPIVDMRAFIHGQTVGKMVTGGGPQIRDLLAARPPAVIIPSYRTEWLPKADQDFIKSRYVPLADDFLVLGTRLPEGGGTFEVHRAGRYRIAPFKASNLEGSYFTPRTLEEFFGSMEKEAAPPVPPLAGTVDGSPLSSEPVELSVGTHRIECAPGGEPTVVWVGPKLDQPPRLGYGDRRELFVNWY